MNFPIPRKNASELILYIWKIIDLPNISYNDLLYKISFDLFLMPPNEAETFIQNLISSNLLTKKPNENIFLSHNLIKKLKNWQLERKKVITSNLKSSQKIKQLNKDLKSELSSDFSSLLKVFIEKGVISRAATISNAAIEIIDFDFNKGLIKAKVAGSKEDFYKIDISVNEKKISHNCHDFQTRRAESKKFCKHLVKLFLLLREKDEKSALDFLSEIGKNINEWDFSA